MRGFNNVVTSNGNSTAEKKMFGGKEYQEELNLDWYDISARNYDPALGRWMNIDPLAEEFISYSPYNAMINNPIIYIDPDGKAAQWIPEVNSETGAISYLAEEGDTAETFVSQYGEPNGIDLEDAQNLIGIADNDIVAGESSISGSDVKDLTGSEVLKLDVTSEMSTPQRRFNQLLFAVDNSRALGDSDFLPSDYYSSTVKTDLWKGASSHIWKNVTFELNGKTIKVSRAIVTLNGNKRISNTGFDNGREHPLGNGIYTRNVHLKGAMFGDPVKLVMKSSLTSYGKVRLNRQQKTTLKQKILKQ